MRFIAHSFVVTLFAFALAGCNGSSPGQQHEFASILHYIEDNWGLGTLGFTDARADDLADCFNYSQTPIVFQPITSAHSAAYFKSLPISNAPVDNE